MPSTSLLTLAFVAAAGLQMVLGTTAKQITVVNSCDFTGLSTCFFFSRKWPALLGQTDAPNSPSGWEAVSGDDQTFEVPDDWLAGRIWARTDCNFSDSAVSGADACLTGGCEGGLECTAYGKAPCTLAEFGMGQYAGADFFDISLVDGFNVPLSITPQGANSDGCTAPSCAADLLTDCPAELQMDFNDAGVAQGCASACIALGGDANCCSGSAATPETCLAAGVAHRDFFKGKCAQAYSFAYDDATSTFTCGSDGAAAGGYKVEFCPSV